MNLPSNISYQTDLIFHRYEGEVEAFSDYWVIRTPSNPTFWFGNFILFPRAPAGGQVCDQWLQVHHQHFGDTLNHRVFGWDECSEGEITAFLENGFKTSHGIALSLKQPSERPRLNPSLEIRPIVSAADWELVAQQQIRCDREDFQYPEDGGAFRRQQLANYQAMSADRRGNWWGAFEGDTLVGNMGLFFDAQNRVGRFQNVGTHPAYRRQRVCTTLLDHIVRDAFDRVGAEQLVICTGMEYDNPSIPTYRNFGFTDAGSSYAVMRAPGRP